MPVISINYTPDTIPTPSGGLLVPRASIDHGLLSGPLVDSLRPQPKPIPMVKVVPYLPWADTLAHPMYNVLTGQFELVHQPGLFDKLHLQPYPAGNGPVERPGAPAPSGYKTPLADSVVADTTLVDTILREQHTISIEKTTLPATPLKTYFTHTDSMLGVIIAILIFFIWLRIGFNRFLGDVVNAAFNYASARRFYDEANALRNRIFNTMNVFYILTLSLFTWQWMNFNEWPLLGFSNLMQFIILVAAWGAIYVLRSMAMHLMDFVFAARGGFLTYHYNVLIYTTLYSLILFPITALIPFVPNYTVKWLFLVAFGAFAGQYFLRLVRGIQIGIKNRLSIFYLILYLCALEILPILVIIRVVQHNL
jgi:hypothetical protein